MVLVLDTSRSIKRRNWPFIINFTASVVQFLDIGLNDSLIGIILFGSEAYIHFNVHRYLDQASLVQAITNTEYNASSGTEMSFALERLHKSSLPNGAMMLREGFLRIAVVVTDGRSHNHTTTDIASQKLHDANLFDQIYAIGIGDAQRIDRDELMSVASNPSTTFFLNDFEESLFIELQNNLSRQVYDICM